jgi:1-acyl-sn-glycerol-3-phosphate acyltransferase
MNAGRPNAAVIDRDPALPRQSTKLFQWACWYAKRYCKQKLHTVKLSNSSSEVIADGRPLIFLMNHSSWWDVMIAGVLANYYPTYQHFAPIDQAMLKQYPFFERLGLFGMEQTPRGAAKFMRSIQAIFNRDHRLLWLMGQGEFVDPRIRPIQLRSGVGYIATKINHGFIVPVALEYMFWTESTPEALIRIGEPIDLSLDQGRNRDEWTAHLSEKLTDCADELAKESMTRDPTHFKNLIDGKTGVGGVYDWMRRFRAWTKGQRFDPSHVSGMERARS